MLRWVYAAPSQAWAIYKFIYLIWCLIPLSTAHLGDPVDPRALQRAAHPCQSRIQSSLLASCEQPRTRPRCTPRAKAQLEIVRWTSELRPVRFLAQLEFCPLNLQTCTWNLIWKSLWADGARSDHSTCGGNRESGSSTPIQSPANQEIKPWVRYFPGAKLRCCVSLSLNHLVH